MTRILVTDDDQRLRELLGQYLSQNGYTVVMAENAKEAREKLQNDSPFDLMVLDVMMPGETGVELVRSLRESFNSIPVLMLSAMGESEDRILGLEQGADDYLSKPFEPRELILRIESLLKRASAPSSSGPRIVKFGPFIFNPKNGDLRKNDEFISLSSSELRLLAVFTDKLDEPISREELSSIFNNISERSVDVQVTRLRKKIEDDPKKPKYLETAWGAGYILRSRSHV